MPQRWFPFDEITQDPEMRVFCFAHAGGNASFFRDWRGTADLVEFYPVQLPGHGTRLSEPPLTRLADIVDAFAEAAEPLLDRPFALFGHSFGAWLAYAAAQQIRTSYGQSTRHLFVSGNVPPPRSLNNDNILLKSDEEAYEYMNIISETPQELLNDIDFLNHIIPIFRNDINILRSYKDDNNQILNCPITAFLGCEDPLHLQASVLAWRDYTSGPFDHHLFPGDHFYLKKYRDELTLMIASSL